MWGRLPLSKSAVNTGRGRMAVSVTVTSRTASRVVAVVMVVSEGALMLVLSAVPMACLLYTSDAADE